MRVLSVTYSEIRDETKFKMAAEFFDADPLIKCDVLEDMLVEINKLYDEAKLEFLNEISEETGRSHNEIRAALTGYPLHVGHPLDACE